MTSYPVNSTFAISSRVLPIEIAICKHGKSPQWNATKMANFGSNFLMNDTDDSWWCQEYFQSVYKTNIYCSFIREMVKYRPSVTGGIVSLLFSLELRSRENSRLTPPPVTSGRYFKPFPSWAVNICILCYSCIHVDMINHSAIISSNKCGKNSSSRLLQM